MNLQNSVLYGTLALLNHAKKIRESSLVFFTKTNLLRSPDVFLLFLFSDYQMYPSILQLWSKNGLEAVFVDISDLLRAIT